MQVAASYNLALAHDIAASAAAAHKIVVAASSVVQAVAMVGALAANIQP